MSSANERQVGGQHYRKGIQHWDFAVTNNFSYLGGQATKYVSRWRDKNGLPDLEKAEHFIQKMIEVHESRPPRRIELVDYIRSQDLQPMEAAVVALIYAYEETASVALLETASAMLRDALRLASEAAPG